MDLRTSGAEVMVMRSRRILALAAMSGFALLGWIFLKASDLTAGVLDHRIVDYYQPRNDLHRLVQARPRRKEFMETYGPRTLIRLSQAGLLAAYKGKELTTSDPLTVYEVAALLGRYIRMVNARDGRVFQGRESLDHQSLWVPRKGWGLFEVEALLSERLLLPTTRPGFWETNLSRYKVAVILSQMLATLGRHYELLRFYEVHPARYYDDFIAYGHPYWFRCEAAMAYGIFQGDGRLFRGLDPIRARELAVCLERLLVVIDGYKREGGRPFPDRVPDPSPLALPVPDPFPRALRIHPQDFDVPRENLRYIDEGGPHPRRLGSGAL